ncbi:MAG: hypothetical protein KF696_05250 [Planctomycetes bacterium]|nr:hypothetical protein [Planctomycetota bacterium]MCW8136292.1 hypothetical protein [Planctomycetota bacterium]
MRHLTLLALCAVAVALSLTTIDRTAEAAGVVWLADYNAALKQAADENKPIFLEFR